ncbi:MAG: MFS transporter [Clostridiales bacterium]|jgi:GPH family glycoside/pentoside/hexuronide:cation symporter|nr:MFS transporter [Clostridiales bacterium]
MKKTAGNKTLLIFCLGDFSRSVFNALTVTYLMYIFIPAEGSTIPSLLPRAAFVFALVRGLGVIFDAVIDPFIASRSDKSTSKRGARISFMRIAAIPMSVFGVLLAFVPYGYPHALNVVWFVVMLFGFNFFSSLYHIPYSALAAEIVTDHKRRVFFYTINTAVFVVGSVIIFAAPIIKNAFAAGGMSELASWRLTFVIFGFFAAVFALIPVVFIKENDYVERKPCYAPLLQSFKATFKYKNFSILIAGYIVMWIAFSFFNFSLMYYITVLIGLNESFSTVVMALTIVVGVASYPLVNRLAKKFGKKPLLIGACIAYTVIYTAIALHAVIVPAIGGTAFAVLIGVFIGFPISITNIIPSSAFADLAQYDTIKTGVNRAGMFSAVRSFILQLAQSIVTFILPALISKGSAAGNATVEGTRLVAVTAAVIIGFSLVFYFLYDDKEVAKTIKEDNERIEREAKNIAV